MPQRLPAAAILVALSVTAGLGADLIGRRHNDGWTLDILHYMSQWPVPAPTAAPAGDDRTVIIAIDEETYRRDPFNLTPTVSWTPQIAAVLNATLDGGAKVIGIDTIFTQSLTYVGTLVPDQPETEQALGQYDRDLLRVLAKGGRAGRIVMSYTRQGGRHLQPTGAQIQAVGGPVNLHPTSMIRDDDGAIRHGLLRAATEDGAQTAVSTLPLELFARSGGHQITFAGDGRPLVDGQPLAGTEPDSLLINFRPVQQDPPIYSFADLYACTQQGKLDYFRQQFAGRTVILGTVLDLEDRHLTSKRFATNPSGLNYAPRCALPIMAGIASDHANQLIPGTYVLAAITDNLKHRDWLRPADESLRLVCLLALTLLTGLIVVRSRAATATGGLVALSVVWPAIACGIFMQNLVLPLAAGLLAIALSLLLSLVYRLAQIDRVRRRLRRSFSLYLPEAELDRLMAQQQMPALGGELRPITILFSDIAHYSTLSEDLPPADLVADLNRYFGRMTEIVQQHGGFVDKFIGDGILAVFGAPLADPAHAKSGVDAAMAMVAACRDDPQLTIKGQRFGIRVGVHTGDAIVGNIGSPSRFNYTVVGDSVNLASRLEGVGKRYHTNIIVSEQTRDQIGDQIAFRELDRVRVVGRDQPVRLFIPLATDEPLTYEPQDWAMALFAWRSGHFGEAAQRCGLLAERGDEIAATFAERATALAASPPAFWDGIVNLSEK